MLEDILPLCVWTAAASWAGWCHISMLLGLACSML